MPRIVSAKLGVVADSRAVVAGVRCITSEPGRIDPVPTPTAPATLQGGTELTLQASLIHDQRSIALVVHHRLPSRASFARALCSGAVLLRASVALAVAVLALVGLLDLSILASA
jgi:hypothetical protein